MANTTFNTRIKLKFDTYNNWHTNNPVLLEGEMAIVEVPASTGQVPNEPAYLLKVGDGVKNFDDLTWISGTAADVHAWAKAATKPIYQASEIQGLDAYISGKVQDTNTKYQIVKVGDYGVKLQYKELNEDSWTDQDDIEFTIPTYSLLEGDTNGTVKFGVTGSEKEVKVHGLQSGAYTDIATLALAEVSCGATEVIGSIKQENGIVTATKKTLTDADIPSIPTSKVTNLDTTLAGKQDTLTFNTPYNADTNKAATMTDVQNAVSGLSGAMHYVGESTTNPSTGTATVEGHEDWAAGDVVTYQSKEYVYDGENWRELGDESSFAIKGSIVDADIAANANIAQSKIANLVTDLAAKATPADITSAIQALDMTAVSVATGNKITSIAETDGVISVQTGAIVADDIPTLPQSKITNLTTDLAAKASQTDLTALTGRVGTLETDNTANKEDIAQLQTDVTNKIDASAVSQIGKTGNINDAIQNSGDYLIFNCGSSSSVI